jgi:hypothetical protein
MTTPAQLTTTAPQVTGCQNWQHQLNAAQLEAQDADLVTYLDGVPPGIDFFQWNGSIWKYVNNMDGSVTTEPDVPSGNTGIFLCTAQAAAPSGMSTGMKTALWIGGGVLVVGTVVGVGVHLHRKSKKRS